MTTYLLIGLVYAACNLFVSGGRRALGAFVLDVLAWPYWALKAISRRMG